jgi:hypothetical protein
MMAGAATWLALAALAGAVVSWVVGVVFFVRTLGASDTRMRWLAIVAWPMALGRRRGAAAEHAGKVNKALVAFMTCVMVAAAAWSVAANLHRIAR